MGGSSLRFFATTLLAVSLSACGPSFDLSINGARQPFNRGAQASVRLEASTAVMVFSGSDDPSFGVVDDESTQQLSVRVDRAQFAALSRGVRLPIELTMTSAAPVSGRGATTLDMFAVTVGATHTAAISAMLIDRSCFCAGPGLAIIQQFSGTMTVERAGTGKVHVRIEAQMNGVIPPAFTATPVRAQVLADAVIDDPGL
ncbi:MAG: hypothetical protein U0269_14360 [Polyangiales bacterium]